MWRSEFFAHMLILLHLVLSPWLKKKKPLRMNRFDKLNSVLRILTDLLPNHYGFSPWKIRGCSGKTFYINNQNILYFVYISMGKEKHTLNLHIVIAFVIRSSHVHLDITLCALFDNSWCCEIELETKLCFVHLRNLICLNCHSFISINFIHLKMSLKMWQYFCHGEKGKKNLVLGYNTQVQQQNIWLHKEH